MKKQPRAVWLALAAGALLVALSVSSAFGADPPDDEKNHGQQVSEFVHSLLFGDPASNDEDEPGDEETQDDEQTAEDEEATDEEATARNADGPPDNHGQCVRVVAMSPDTGGPNDNHGGAVSEAARVTCWEDSEGGDEEATDEESADGPPDNHGQCVRVVAMSPDTGGPNDNHGGAVSEAARVTCWEDSEGGEEVSVESTDAAQRGNRRMPTTSRSMGTAPAQ